MLHHDLLIVLSKILAQLVRDHDRAMTPAGAADGDGEIGLPLGDVAGDDRVEERAEAPHELAVRSLPGDVGVTWESVPGSGRRRSTQCGFGRNRTSRTRSASRGSPY